MTLLGAYGRALADVGSYQQALDVLGRAHTPDQPDWRILSVQGAVLDQMGRHADAQRYYATALKIVPEEPSVLSNLGLSYALSRNLPAGGSRRCGAPPRVRAIHACGRISPWWSDCRAASRKPSRSRAPTCRPTKPPPTSPICGTCWRSRTPCESPAPRFKRVRRQPELNGAGVPARRQPRRGSNARRNNLPRLRRPVERAQFAPRDLPALRRALKLPAIGADAVDAKALRGAVARERGGRGPTSGVRICR